MQLVFDLGDDADAERYPVVRDQLLDEMREWVAGRLDDPDGELTANAETFLSYKVGYSDGDLADISIEEAEMYLLGWAPRKVSMAPDEAPQLVRGLSAYAEFMAATGRLRGGFAHAASVMTHLADLDDAVVEAMADTSNFGIGKSLLTAELTGADGLRLPLLDEIDGVDPGDLQRLLDQRMDAFNALPFEQRRALTDSAFTPPAPPRIELPFVLVIPDAAAIDRAIGASRLIGWVRGLVEWLGPNGRSVTQAGNLKLADARYLVTTLATGDEVDPELPWGKETTRSSRDLPMLTLVVDLAIASGAATQARTKLLPGDDWPDLTPLDQARRVLVTLLDIGPLTMTGRGSGVWEALDNLLDDGVAHWMTGVLPPGEQRTLDEIIEFARHVVREHPALGRSWGTFDLGTTVAERLHVLFELLAAAGLIELDDMDDHVTWFRRDVRALGDRAFVATDLARAVMPPVVHAAGYDLVVIDDLDAAEPEAIVRLVADGDVELDDAVGRWWADRPPAERIEALTEAAATANSTDRIAIFALLGEMDGPSIGHSIRRLLDTPASAHAAMFLLDRGLASPDEVGGFLSLGPIVDMLFELVEAPTELAATFADIDQHAEEDVLDGLWRVDQPETLAVLQALGRHLPDKRRAKSARLAANKHRSWRANR